MDVAKQRAPMIMTGAVLVCCAAMLSVATQFPAPYAPFSMPVLAPAIMLSIFDFSHFILIFFGAIPLTITYIFCMLKGSRQFAEISNIGILLVTFSGLVSVIFNAAWFQQGIAEQGWLHVIFISLLNIGFISTLPLAYWHYLQNRTLFRYLRFYTVYFVWLGFCAFPWYGQTL
jgi:hypothetical protein